MYIFILVEKWGWRIQKEEGWQQRLKKSTKGGLLSFRSRGGGWRKVGGFHLRDGHGRLGAVFNVARSRWWGGWAVEMCVSLRSAMFSMHEWFFGHWPIPCVSVIAQGQLARLLTSEDTDLHAVEHFGTDLECKVSTCLGDFTEVRLGLLCSFWGSFMWRHALYIIMRVLCTIPTECLSHLHILSCGPKIIFLPLDFNHRLYALSFWPIPTPPPSA